MSESRAREKPQVSRVFFKRESYALAGPRDDLSYKGRGAAI